MSAKPYTPEEADALTRHVGRLLHAAQYDAFRLVATLEVYAAMREAMSEIAKPEHGCYECGQNRYADEIARRFSPLTQEEDE